MSFPLPVPADPLPMFPLERTALPDEGLTLNVFEPRFHALVQDCLDAWSERPRFGVVLIERGSEVGGGEVRTDIGTIVEICSTRKHSCGRLTLDAVVCERIRVRSWLDDDPYPRALVEGWPDQPTGGVSPEDLMTLEFKLRLLDDRMDELAFKRSTSAPIMPTTVDLWGEPGAKLLQLARELPMGDSDRQRVLSAPGAAERVRVLCEILDSGIEQLEFWLSVP
ncbi:LON peptidase substrate-binding domain-containing protein [Speluncibacter jeojiensis]|uniref:LON peptidase substrate-binding domain-containing protein n=1 Tax=Speluncibacter jeojiensis TaxID=2710754 RepID=A0A9X4M2C9_9ACTN|nr:LON peptidase substrate-binding domain-containing protein [Corynebacteriales bacterium D3-21]